MFTISTLFEKSVFPTPATPPVIGDQGESNLLFKKILFFIADTYLWNLRDVIALTNGELITDPFKSIAISHARPSASIPSRSWASRTRQAAEL